MQKYLHMIDEYGEIM